ncbi:cell wall hydrolase [Phaeovulum sp.]|uniref:cell wall hydrolase n=1 Tax=Phaeovulum sp. TaxID=2934796 RepID=UPI002730B839|nr:cell wall hydrolase [Phaeovulum sp.]MDP1669456.1 cell wall hydrolase [Phaeovulum sp.]MDZ4118265.1 cell wall hydrolase [Phaeovulum sp.]
MSVMVQWAERLALLLFLAVPAAAETAVSTSNDPAGVGPALAVVLGQERTALAALPEQHFAALTEEPQQPFSLFGRREAPGVIIDGQWLAAQPEATGDAQFECLRQALYFEARGEPVSGQVAVAEVILNRVADPAFPNTICGVVKQSNGRGCQFSYYCDGRTDTMRDLAAVSRVGKVARALIDGAPRALTGGATFFHAFWVRPSWRLDFERTTQIGVHTFYRKPVRTAVN